MLNLGKIVGKFLKRSNQREIAKLKAYVEKINVYEEEIKNLSNDKFPLKTSEFKSKVQKGMGLDELIPETFALVREAARRSLWFELFKNFPTILPRLSINI